MGDSQTWSFDGVNTYLTFIPLIEHVMRKELTSIKLICQRFNGKPDILPMKYKEGIRNIEDWHNEVDGKENVLVCVKFRVNEKTHSIFAFSEKAFQRRGKGTRYDIIQKDDKGQRIELKGCMGCTATYNLLLPKVEVSSKNNPTEPRLITWDENFIVFGNTDLRIRNTDFEEVYSNFATANCAYTSQTNKKDQLENFWDNSERKLMSGIKVEFYQLTFAEKESMTQNKEVINLFNERYNLIDGKNYEKRQNDYKNKIKAPKYTRVLAFLTANTDQLPNQYNLEYQNDQNPNMPLQPITKDELKKLIGEGEAAQIDQLFLSFGDKNTEVNINTYISKRIQYFDRDQADILKYLIKVATPLILVTYENRYKFIHSILLNIFDKMKVKIGKKQQYADDVIKTLQEELIELNVNAAKVDSDDVKKTIQQFLGMLATLKEEQEKKLKEEEKKKLEEEERKKLEELEEEKKKKLEEEKKKKSKEEIDLLLKGNKLEKIRQHIDRQTINMKNKEEEILYLIEKIVLSLSDPQDKDKAINLLEYLYNKLIRIQKTDMQSIPFSKAILSELKMRLDELHTNDERVLELLNKVTQAC